MERLVSILTLTALATLAGTTVAAADAFPVPEPTSLSLVALGVGGLYVARKLRRRK